MSKFPAIINIRVLDAFSNVAIEGLAVMLHFFTDQKNNYEFIPPISNCAGEIIVNKQWINKKIENERNIFIMDYCSTINDCKPYVEIRILDNKDVIRAIETMKDWQRLIITPEEVDNLRKATNIQYKPVSKLVKFNDKDILDIVIETQKA